MSGNLSVRHPQPPVAAPRQAFFMRHQEQGGAAFGIQGEDQVGYP
jgi:hypothetical protein